MYIIMYAFIKNLHKLKTERFFADSAQLSIMISARKNRIFMHRFSLRLLILLQHLFFPSLPGFELRSRSCVLDPLTITNMPAFCIKCKYVYLAFKIQRN